MGQLYWKFLFYKVGQNNFAEIFLHVLTCLTLKLIKVCTKAMKNSVVIEESVTEKIILKITESKCSGKEEVC